jgi:hypothetical protein
MRSNIDNATREAKDTVRNIIAANPSMSEGKKKALYEDVDRYAAESLARYADDKGTGLVAMASILRNYRDKTVQERQQLLDLHIKITSATANSPLGEQYRQGGEARKRLEREQPYFYQFMVKQENTIARLAQGLTGEIDGAANLADMRRVDLQARTDPAAVPVDPVADTNTTKAAHEMLYASAKQALNKTDLRPEEVTLVSATLSTGALYGANTRVLAKDYKKFSEQISKLSEPDQAIIKGNVSNSVSMAIRNIQETKSLIESRYKVTLEIGVNSAGELGVVAPKVPTPRYGTTPGSFTRVSSEYLAAAKTFTEQLKPLLNNSVYSRAMLTNEQPSAVSQEFATLINNGQPYNGFFSMEAMPVAPAVQSAGTPSSPEAIPVAPAPAATASKPAPAATPAAPAASAAKPGEDNTKALGLTSTDTLGYQTRGLFAGEDTYFKQNPNVAGMATEDGKIIINPYSTLSNTEKKAVVKNEAFRLYMRENNVVPNFAVTPQQKEAFKNTEYNGNETALKQTIVARILTGDTSALATPEQKAEAKRIQQQAGSKGAAKPAATSSGKEWWEQ